MAIINVNGISGINSITAQSGSLNFFTAAGNNLPITAATLNVGTGASVSSPATNVLTLGTNNVESVRINSSGNVGINSTSPRSKLDVGGDLTLGRIDSSIEGGQVSLCRSTDNATAWSMDVYGSTSTPSLRFVDGIAAASRMEIDGSGRVLVGTSTSVGSASKLQILGNTASDALMVRNGDTNYEAFVVQCASGESRIISSSGGSTTRPSLTFYTNDAERLRINSSGNVGIGTTNPAVPLSISGTGGGAYLDILNGGDIRLFPAGQYTGSSQNVSIYCDSYGVLSIGGTILPGADNTYSLGSTSFRWAHIYTADLHMSNEGFKNDIDGTWGKYTIQEGENDLFLINRRTGKRYKFLLEEVK